MFAGAGGSGVKNMSSHSQVMPGKCVTCHLYRAEEEKKEKKADAPPKKGGHTFRVDDRICLKCHEDTKSLVVEWQAKITPLLKRLKALLDSAPNKTSKPYKAARLNYDIVIADGGTGLHNPRYAQALLRYSISSLTAESLWRQ